VRADVVSLPFTGTLQVRNFMQEIGRFMRDAAGVCVCSAYTEPRRNGRAAAVMNSVPTNRT